MAKSERERAQQYICQNKKARHEYFLEETVEAGLALMGSEVKSLREGRAHLTDAYAVVENGELWLMNSHIAEYANASRQNHEPRRRRKLLLHRNEIRKLAERVEERGYTLLPLALYFNERGLAKASLALGKGKRQYDKRADSAKRDAKREMDRALKSRRGRE